LHVTAVFLVVASREHDVHAPSFADDRSGRTTLERRHHIEHREVRRAIIQREQHPVVGELLEVVIHLAELSA
jgi:hypothetical protein